MEISMPILDSHRHFWHYNDTEFGWIADECLRKDFLPGGALGDRALPQCIAVEARQSIEETDWLLSMAADPANNIAGVVGWLPIAADNFPEILAQYGRAGSPLPAAPRLVGLRHVVQDEPDDDFILRPNFVRGVKHLLAQGYTYDILVFERHLKNVIKFVDELPPDARLVLDHMGKPHNFSTWAPLISELAQRQNVYCKLSGLVTELQGKDQGRGHSCPREQDIRPYLDLVLSAFGPERCMFGSDYPVVSATTTYDWWLNQILPLGPAVLHDTAARFYQLFT